MLPKLIVMLFLTTALVAQESANADPYPLLNGSVAVNASSYYSIPFYASEKFNRVSGRFRAEGSINAYIFDEDGMTNFRGGAKADTYFNSGNVIVANIDVRLPPGAYYLVFQNKNVLASKTVVGYVVQLRNLLPCSVKRGGAIIIRSSDGKRIRLVEGAELRLLRRTGKYSIVTTISYEGRIPSSRITCEN